MSDLKEKVLDYNREVKAALETILGELNQGQRKKISANPVVAALLERYGVAYKDGNTN